MASLEHSLASVRSWPQAAPARSIHQRAATVMPATRSPRPSTSPNTIAGASTPPSLRPPGGVSVSSTSAGAASQTKRVVARLPGSPGTAMRAAWQGPPVEDRLLLHRPGRQAADRDRLHGLHAQARGPSARCSTPAATSTATWPRSRPSTRRSAARTRSSSTRVDAHGPQGRAIHRRLATHQRRRCHELVAQARPQVGVRLGR